MRDAIQVLSAVALGAALIVSAGAAQGQTQAPLQADCQALRERLADHARLSDGVRRALAASAARYPAQPPGAPQPARAAQDRGTRLQQIARERQQLEDLRLAAMVRFDVARAMELQTQIDALERERVSVEKQSPDPQSPPAQPPSQASPLPVTSVDRIPCNDIPFALDAAKKTRRKELGAREDLGVVIPLVPLKGQGRDQIAKELWAQFSAWPDAALEIGLLDQDGDGRMDGFVDVPVRDLFRLVRQRSDGGVSIEVFSLPGRAADTDYDEIARRLDETIARQTGRQVADLVAAHPAGPIRIVAQTADFAAAHAQFSAGNYADAGRIGTPAARASEFQNLRGESGRLLEIIAPAPGGVVLRRILVLPRPNNQEQWDETILTVAPRSYWRSDVDLTASRQTRTTAGAAAGAPTVTGPIRFSLER